MKIICAPDSFKDALGAADAARAMAQGCRLVDASIDVDVCPVADGGEGFTQAIAAATKATLHVAEVIGPRCRRRSVRFAIFQLGVQHGHDKPQRLPRTAVMEMAVASGLELLAKPEREPLLTTTFGTGQLIQAALNHRVERILLGIGGSATNDAGCGAAQALGVSFYDQHDKLMTQPITGGDLLQIKRIDTTTRDPRLDQVELLIACDVTNPLTGKNGAAHVYAPQKGASPQEVEQLDAGLRHVAQLFRQQLQVDVETVPGSGAAGGLGGGAMAMLGGTLKRGIELVLDAVQFEQRVKSCDLCLTGEGRLDGQTASGKAIMGVVQAAKKHGVPTIALVGCVGDNVEKTLQAGLHDYIIIGEGLSPEESIKRTAELLEKSATRAVTACEKLVKRGG